LAVELYRYLAVISLRWHQVWLVVNKLLTIADLNSAYQSVSDKGE
jgi:hypothetical protein